MPESGPLKKVYVVSGKLHWVGFAQGPLDATFKALDSMTKRVTLDPDFFFIDERGFRTEEAFWKVPVDVGLTHAGYEDAS
jgi:hypothetical protein